MEVTIVNISNFDICISVEGAAVIKWQLDKITFDKYVPSLVYLLQLLP